MNRIKKQCGVRWEWWSNTRSRERQGWCDRQIRKLLHLPLNQKKMAREIDFSNGHRRVRPSRESPCLPYIFESPQTLYRTSNPMSFHTLRNRCLVRCESPSSSVGPRLHQAWCWRRFQRERHDRVGRWIARIIDRSRDQHRSEPQLRGGTGPEEMGEPTREIMSSIVARWVLHLLQPKMREHDRYSRCWRPIEAGWIWSQGCSWLDG